MMAPLACLSIFAAARPAGDGPGAADPPALGLRYDINLTITNTTTEGGQPTTSSGSSVARVQIADGKARIDVVSGEFAAILSAGDFMTFSDSGHTALIFKPSTQQYYQLDLQKLNAGLTHVVNTFGAAIGVQASNVKIDVTSLGAGDPLGPYATVKYRLTQDYTLAVSLLGMNMGQSAKMHSTTDYLFAPKLTILVNPFAETVQGTAWLGADYGKQLAAAEAKLQNGVPVKKVTTEVLTDSTGPHTTTTTWELAGFTRVNVPDSAFQIPVGYTQIQPPATLTQTMSNVSSDPVAAMKALSSTATGAAATVNAAAAKAAASTNAAAANGAVTGSTATGTSKTTGTSTSSPWAAATSTTPSANSPWAPATAPAGSTTPNDNSGVAGAASTLDSATATMNKKTFHLP